MEKKIGIADTTFARADMGGLAERTLLAEVEKAGYKIKIERYTVPGIKDLAIACKKLFKEKNCDLVMALGMVGRAEIDRQCALVASLIIRQVEIEICKHILEVFVHEEEAKNDKELAKIMHNRTVKHCSNALWLLFDQETLRKRAGTGRRQGFEDEPFFEI